MPEQADLSGMTVNERLFTTGQMDEFEQALEQHRLDDARRILKSIDLDATDVEAVIAKHVKRRIFRGTNP